jgi:HK97 family phage major capsid protein
MAISAATVTGDFSGFIQPTIATAIFERATRMSVVQQLARQVPLGFNGTSVPVVTGRPSAGWVDEAGTKPATAGAMTLKSLVPKKLAAVVVVSAEVVRADPGGYMNALRPQLAEAFAIAFDRAALHDEGPTGGAGGGPFATFIDQTTKTVELGTTPQNEGGIHGDLTAALSLLVSDSDASGRRYRLSGWALDDLVEPLLEGAVDTTGRPLYVDLPPDENAPVLPSDMRPVTRGRLMRRPSFMGEGVANTDASILGYAGDWTQAAWGVVGGISYRVSTEAAVTIDGSLVSAFEHNLVAIVAEAEYGFLVNDPEAFVELADAES